MPEFFQDILATDGFVPWSHCGDGWTECLVTWRIVASLAIGLSCVGISLWFLFHKSLFTVSRTVMCLFAAFILLAGWVFVMDALMAFHPALRLDVAARVLSAIASLILLFVLPVARRYLLARRHRNDVDLHNFRERVRDRVRAATERARHSPENASAILTELERDLAHTD